MTEIENRVTAEQKDLVIPRNRPKTEQHVTPLSGTIDWKFEVW